MKIGDKVYWVKYMADEGMVCVIPPHDEYKRIINNRIPGIILKISDNRYTVKFDDSEFLLFKDELECKRTWRDMLK